MKKVLATALTGATVFVSNAYAAVPADITTALDDAKADSITIATAALVIIIGIAAFGYMRRAK